MTFTFPFSLLSEKRMIFVFSEETGQRLMHVCFALAQINAVVIRSHGRVWRPSVYRDKVNTLQAF